MAASLWGGVGALIEFKLVAPFNPRRIFASAGVVMVAAESFFLYGVVWR